MLSNLESALHRRERGQSGEIDIRLVRSAEDHAAAFHTAEGDGLEVCNQHHRLADEILRRVPLLDAGDDGAGFFADFNRELEQFFALLDLLGGNDLGKP